MTSTFSGLEIGKLGLFAQQTALNTTGHNISNANTEGYTRQRVNMEAMPAFPYPSAVNNRSAGQVGTGVWVSSIERLRTAFLDLQFRGENKNAGEYGARTDTLEKIENILNEPTDSGLQKTMDDFWGAWQQLSANPKDTSAREVVRQKATTMTESFAFIQREMIQQQNNVNEDIGTKTTEIQGYLDTVAKLNAQINDIVPHGYTPNDLYDQRDLILDKLSKSMDIEVKPVTNNGKDTGMVDVYIKGTNVNLVSEKAASVVKAEASTAAPPNNTLRDGTTTKLDINIYCATLRSGTTPPQAPDQSNLATWTPANPNYQFSEGGELKGLLASRDTILPDYMTRISNLATKIATEVNKVHKSGKDLDGNQQGGVDYAPTITPIPPSTKSALPFFVSKQAYETAKVASPTNPNPHNDNDPTTWNWMNTPPTGPGDMIVNPLIMKSVNKIAASDPNSGTGDNKTALAIYALKEQTNMVFGGAGGETGSFDSYTRSIISKLGSETREAQRMKTNVESLTSEVDNRRQSVSGVSLDEEMSNMIKFQHSYSACARTITAMDEMLDQIINKMGLVGR
ncbi:flagellar hook-associated protein 1 FlgK [Aneurinibacillus soli]|uniref:Flagellar hook-associated protein 1 n=1 Tax=Aneurinibacillus soli TaxID=1500254 RepID=A0A0U5B6F9_9BACL|nr:flagellar hook-associated protein FlgK [Aneurinibacillus soli]PYE61489.1 flagellar hook-associated protein 1 FlgK [Aneurinibacillus soli]BAU26556.1 Flagellar hook-associated protein 1 [Aneurinibacillus soli]